MNQTREGNPIYPKNSPYRVQPEIIVNTYKSFVLCCNCKHLGDLCTGQLRDFARVVKSKTRPHDIIAVDGIGRSWVVTCEGFEQ